MLSIDDVYIAMRPEVMHSSILSLAAGSPDGPAQLCGTDAYSTGLLATCLIATLLTGEYSFHRTKYIS